MLGWFDLPEIKNGLLYLGNFYLEKFNRYALTY